MSWTLAVVLEKDGTESEVVVPSNWVKIIRLLVRQIECS